MALMDQEGTLLNVEVDRVVNLAQVLVSLLCTGCLTSCLTKGEREPLPPSKPILAVILRPFSRLYRNYKIAAHMGP